MMVRWRGGFLAEILELSFCLIIVKEIDSFGESFKYLSTK
jgi:hypothetical protein